MVNWIWAGKNTQQRPQGSAVLVCSKGLGDEFVIEKLIDYGC
jgi:hypothetical protein